MRLSENYEPVHNMNTLYVGLDIWQKEKFFRFSGIALLTPLHLQKPLYISPEVSYVYFWASIEF